MLEQIHLSILNILLLISCSSGNEIESFVFYPKDFVRVGENATLVCSFPKLPPGAREFSIMIRRGGSFLSEGCGSYKISGYNVTCQPPNSVWADATSVTFTIENVTWADSDAWSCIYGNDHKTFNLPVFDGAPINNIQVVATDNNKNVLRQAHSGGKFQGQGFRTNPYDLRPQGYQLNVTCSSGCGFPATKFSWIVTASNGTKIKLSNQAISIQEALCALSNSNHSQRVKVVSNVTIDCSKMNLTGLNQLTCMAEGNQYSPSKISSGVLNKSFFFVCIGGERPMTLTPAEVIAIIIGSIIFFAFIIGGCVIIRKYSRKDYSSMPDTSVPTLNI